MKPKIGLSVLMAFFCFLFSILFPTFSWSDPPVVTALPATNVDITSATLNGTVNANLLSTTVTFYYGLDTTYSSGSVTADQSPVTGNTDTAVSANIIGLIPNRTYHFAVVGNNGDGGDIPSEDMTFETLGGPPVVTALPATNVDITSATLNGTVNANLLSTTVTFYYGLDTTYSSGSVTADQSPVTGNTDTTVSANITGLIPNRTYHFAVVGNNGDGGDIPSEDMTFFTSVEVTKIPTLSEWGMIIFTFLMAVIAIVVLRRRNITA